MKGQNQEMEFQKTFLSGQSKYSRGNYSTVLSHRAGCFPEQLSQALFIVIAQNSQLCPKTPSSSVQSEQLVSSDKITHWANDRG